MIQKEAVDRPIAAVHKDLCKAANIQPLHAFLAIVATTQKLNARVGVV